MDKGGVDSQLFRLDLFLYYFSLFLFYNNTASGWVDCRSALGLRISRIEQQGPLACGYSNRPLNSSRLQPVHSTFSAQFFIDCGIKDLNSLPHLQTQSCFNSRTWPSTAGSGSHRMGQYDGPTTSRQSGRLSDMKPRFAPPPRSTTNACDDK